MMFELLIGPLGLLFVAAIIWWGITFNMRLEERYGCTACTFWGVIGGIVGTFCWVLSSGASGGSVMERLIAGGIAATITLALFYSNREKSGSTFQGIMMTVWQLFVGLVVFGIFAMLDSGKKKKGK